MIIVTGSIQARPESLDLLISASLEHVRRSRAEPGCVSHAVHQDVEDPLRLVFVEQWTDKAALLTHFAVPASSEFVTAVTAFAAGPSTLHIYDAQLAQLGSQGNDP